MTLHTTFTHQPDDAIVVLLLPNSGPAGEVHTRDLRIAPDFMRPKQRCFMTRAKPDGTGLFDIEIAPKEHP